MAEEIALVDLDDHITGYASKSLVHQEGLLHRAFSIFIIDGSKMLLQKRNPNKYHSGGLWTNACCSHQRKGEELEEATHRRLKEELGFSCPLKELFTFVYRTHFIGGVTEFELDHVFIGSYDSEIRANPDEINDLRWIDAAELKRELAQKPEKYTSWFIISAPQVLKYLENINEDIGSNPSL